MSRYEEWLEAQRAAVAERRRATYPGELAAALLLTTPPSDRALAGWGIDSKQLRGLVAIAKRGPGWDD